MRIIFAGTSEYAVPSLKLLNQHYDIVLVITQPDRPAGRRKKLTPPIVKTVATEMNLPVFQPENINSDDSVEFIQKYNPDLLITASYGQILKKKILNLPKYYCVNLHASLLPKYRGAAPINWVLINGEKATGNTTFIMNRKMDAGDILLQNEIKIHDNMNATELHNILAESGAQLLLSTCQQIEKGAIIPTKQDESLISFAPKLDNNLAQINWNKPAIEIHNLIRGLAMSPGAYTYYNNIKIKIFETQIGTEKSEYSPGTIFNYDKKNGFYVATGTTTIFIKLLQKQGKKILTYQDFWNGHIIQIGNKFT